MISQKISVIMAVYNCSQTVSEAIESILSQTYQDFELIICDDCSTDETYKIILSYQQAYPDKIVLLRNERNSKLAFSLNRCLRVAQGEYIARMDGDDISLPARFERQVQFLQQNKDIDLVGTAMQRFDKDHLADIAYAVERPDRYTLRRRMPFYHATIMTYKRVYDELSGYTVAKRTERAQDYDLWFKFYYQGFNGANIQEPLYLVRENESAIKRRTFRVRFNAFKTTVYGYRLLKYPLHWYFRPAITMIFKGVTPTRLMLYYRKIQCKNFERKCSE